MTLAPSGCDRRAREREYSMELGMIGLGRMGANLRYQCSGHEEQHS